MKDRYRLIRRRNRYYAVDRHTRTRESLETDNLRIARRLLVAKNEAAQQTNLNLLIGRTYLGANDPNMVLRTWQLVMDEFCQRGKEQTWVRRKRAMRTAALAGLKPKKLVETTADDLREAMTLGGASVNHFLRCLHNLALGMGWIPGAIIPPKLWPQPQRKEKRAITLEEHELVIATEKNLERRDFYQLLWEIGSAQSDGARLTVQNIDWENRVLTYQRQKTGEWASIQIGKRLGELLRRLPSHGFLFPKISQTTAGGRSGDFWRRCKVAKIFGVSLHSYRYAWAQRARASGYRFTDGHELLLTSRALRAREELDPLVAKYGSLISQLLEPNLTEHEWWRAMHRWRQAGWSYHRIATELNRLNVPTKTGAGNVIIYKGAKRLSHGRWQCGNVHKVFHSRNTQDWLRQMQAA